MNLLEEITLKIINYLTYDDIANLKKSEIIHNISNDKFHEILSKKLLTKMMKQYSDAEYKNVDVFSDDKLKNIISRFCFSSLISEFAYGINLTSDQINKMVPILTNEQLEKISYKLDKNPNGWY